MRYLKFILYATAICVICMTFFIFYLLWKYSPELPSYEKIINYKPNLSSRIYSSDGLLLKSFYLEERIFIPIQRIPYNIKMAFISAEDKNFYKHFGVDIFAIFRAIFTNISTYYTDKRVIGASTITQQVVKNLLLSNELSYERKIKEIILALRIENILSKDEILELYLNDIYLGFGSYGIGTASLNYFNKSINELNLSEISFLAALPKAPNNYNPLTKYSQAIERRNWVIDRMFENKYITNKELKYKTTPIIVNDRTENYYTKADYYYEEIRKELFKKFGKDKLYSDGLIIKTSINSDIQTLADESLYQGIMDYDKSQGWNGPITNIKLNDFGKNQMNFMEKNPYSDKWKVAIVSQNKFNDKITLFDFNKKKIIIDLQHIDNQWLKNESFIIGDVVFVEKINNHYVIRQLPKANGAIVVINPHNGDVLALSGGYSFKLSEFNRATQAKRQPGSAFKPFVYMAALNEGYTPSTLVLDAPYVIDQGPGLPKWKPANYTEEFYGLTTMRTGIEKSRNLMTVRLAHKIGMEKIISIAKEFGIDKGLDKKLSMALGSGLVTLLDLTNAYAMIANGGKKIHPRIIKSIYSKEGIKILETNLKKCENCKLQKINSKFELPILVTNEKKVIDSKIAFQITSMMEGVISRGTARKLKDLGIPLAGKTGTTNDNKDAWFIGYTPNIVIGVYVGHDKPTSLGYKQTGSSVAVPIFKYFAKKNNINSSKIPFKVPNGISFVRIDPATGLSSNTKGSILEPYILGTEPFMNNINILDSFGEMKNNSISGTGGLLN